MMINKLLQKFEKHKISGFQIAVNGIWENAKSIPVFPNTQHKQAILSWLSTQERDVAIEIFFNCPDNKFMFIGLRLAKLTVMKRHDFVEEILSLPPNISPLETIPIIEEKLNSRIMHTAYDFLEIGILNEWKSQNPYKISQKNNINEPYESIINHAPHLSKSFNNPVILEFAWKHPIPMWVGVPISTSQGGKHTISKEAYNRYFLENL